MYYWKITIEAWPYFGVDQEAAGPRSQDFHVHADEAADALKLGKMIATGIEASPAVWRAPIKAIVMVGEMAPKELAPVSEAGWHKKLDTTINALEKVRSYNTDILCGRINYRAEDHIQVIDRALREINDDTPALSSENAGGQG